MAEQNDSNPLQRGGSVIVQFRGEMTVLRYMGSTISSNILLINDSNLWMIFKANCNQNHELCINSNLTGLLSPQERRILVLKNVAIGENGVLNCRLIVEAAVCLETNNPRTELNTDTIWSSMNTNRVTICHIRFLLKDSTTLQVQNDTLICLVPNPRFVIRKTISGRMKSVLKRMRQEDLTTESLVILLVIFGVGVAFGYACHKSGCPNAGKLCTGHF